MKIQIEDEHTTASINTKSKELSAVDAVRLCYSVLLGMGYQPISISEAMSEVGEEKS